ncbi:hypothetical protein BZA05DRAFT_388836 [Tricharina praecox]|uniref:uncharacterized protein n=1 Tax=Tricharina praecox TaxID=43433 RepID=UPI0022212640|nr:uncharacterized protein BZA05DRAFT_388836 [Tricharina praecox]KAI5856516.1 hypothetical protein BZA05DRAFT_388836 [Tricharina praecox]
MKRAASSVVMYGVERMEEEEKTLKVEVKVGGRLWTAALPVAAPVVTHPPAPLWTAATASRTTTAVPERVETAPRKKSDYLPKATGSLWAKVDITVKKGRVVVFTNSLWDQQPERLQRPAMKRVTSSVVVRGFERKAEEKEGVKVEVKVGGRLWTAALPVAAPIVTHPPAPLWTAATASRTTTTIPERVETAPRKKSDYLPKAIGSLWSVRIVEVKKAKIVLPGALWQADAAAFCPVLQKSSSTSSRSLTVAPPRKLVDDRWKVVVGGRLWTAEAIPVVVAPSLVKVPLWSKETAERTTDAVPERIATAQRKMGGELKKATGSLWNLRDVQVEKAEVVVAAEGLWGSQECYRRAERKSLTAVGVAMANRLWNAPVPKSVVVEDAPSPLWRPATASRTTTAVPERGMPVPRKMVSDPPKASGSLWSIRDVEIKPAKIVVDGGLWQAEGSPFVECSQLPTEVKPEVAGRLWTATSAPAPPPPPPTETLWSAPALPPVIMEKPEHSEFSKYTASLPPREAAKRNPVGTHTSKATGSLWSPDPIPEANYAIHVGGRLWAVHHTAPPSPAQSSKLWTPRTTPSPPLPAPAESQQLLWHAATASRTTTAKPGRSLSISRKRSVNLHKATGSLWGEPERDNNNNDDELPLPVPSLSRTSTVSDSSEDDDDEYIPVVRMWQPVASSGRKGVVVLGQQSRARYYSSFAGAAAGAGAGAREQQQQVFLERVGRGKVRVSSASASTEKRA